MKNPGLLSVVIPVYNEAAIIKQLCEAVTDVLSLISLDFELILVDDGSSDSTWDMLCQQTSYQRPSNDNGFIGCINIFGLSRNFGKEAAISAGLSVSKGDAVIVMDGDLQHPPSYIPGMVSLWKDDGYDVVEGIKSYRGAESFFHKLNAQLFYKVFRKTAGIDLRNASDFKLLSRKVVNKWLEFSEHDTFFRGLSAWLGYRRARFTFEVAPRLSGKTGWSFPRLIRLSINAITAFTAFPLQFVTIAGCIFILFSIAIAVQTLFNWITHKAADGFTTVILLILLTGGCIMLSLGLIGIYLGRIFTEVKARPRFIISRSNKNIPDTDCKVKES